MEVLGPGGLGTSYKAVLDEGIKYASSPRAWRLWSTATWCPAHVLLLQKDKKLLVLDYLPGGSLSARATVACLLLLVYDRALNSVCQISLFTTAYPQICCTSSSGFGMLL